MSDVAFPIIFNDGKQGYHKGIVSLTVATTFDSFLRQVSSRIPGLDPQHFHIVIVLSRAGAPAEARQYIPIHENTNFCVVANQHSPMADQAAHFMVTLKRPEQRQLDQQRKMMNQQQHRALDCMEDQVQQLPHPGPLLGPQRRQPGLTGAAYPWAGMPHPPVTPQMQQAWNATQEPAAHNMQGTMVKRQANMWGAVPQHHHAVPPAQAQQFVLAQAQAAAQAQAQVQAQAQAQAMRHVDAPPPPPAQMGGFPHSAHLQSAHGQASAAFQAAQHAQHGAGFVLPPPPPPANPNFGNTARGPAHSEHWNRGAIPAIHMQQGRPAQPQSPRPRPLQPVAARPSGGQQQQPCPSPSRMQPPEQQPFRPTRILTHADSGRLGQRSRRAGQNEGQEPLKAEENPSSPSTGPPGSPAAPLSPLGFASLHQLKISGSANLDDDFWCGSPCDHILHPLQIKRHNPFGAVSSPRANRSSSGQGFE